LILRLERLTRLDWLTRLSSIDDHARWLRDTLLFAEHFSGNYSLFVNFETINILF